MSVNKGSFIFSFPIFFLSLALYWLEFSVQCSRRCSGSRYPCFVLYLSPLSVIIVIGLSITSFMRLKKFLRIPSFFIIFMGNRCLKMFFLHRLRESYDFFFLFQFLNMVKYSDWFPVNLAFQINHLVMMF